MHTFTYLTDSSDSVHTTQLSYIAVPITYLLDVIFNVNLNHKKSLHAITYIGQTDGT